MKRWILGAVSGLVLGAVIILGAETWAEHGSVKNRVVALTVEGLPAGKEASLWGVVGSPGNLDRVEKVGSIRSGASPEFVMESPTLEVGTVVESEGTRYVPSSRYYQLNPGDNRLTIVYRRQHNIAVGTYTRAEQPPERAHLIDGAVRLSPEPDGGFYDENSIVQVEPTGESDLQFAYWLITNGESGRISTRVGQFTSAANPLSIRVTQPLYVQALFVNKWYRAVSKGVRGTITITNLFPGQIVRLIADGKEIAQASVGEGRSDATLAVPEGRTISGSFVITAPDAQTTIFSSGVYSDLVGGDMFSF